MLYLVNIAGKSLWSTRWINTFAEEPWSELSGFWQLLIVLPSEFIWRFFTIFKSIVFNEHLYYSIVRSGDAIYVRVGDHDLTSRYELNSYGLNNLVEKITCDNSRYGSPGAQTLRVATTYIHHNHNSQTLDNDIALLKLQGQAELKPGVCIICLPSRGSIPETGRRCTVTGYGYMGESKWTTLSNRINLI